jgi:oligopeptide/dipeptide ABC transporter ATP-binding protein
MVGESGCGKSLSALSIPLLLPREAEILEGSISFGEIPELRSLGEEELRRIRGKEISFVFQEARQSLNPLIRVGPQIAEALELHGSRGIGESKKRRTQVLELMENLGFKEAEKIYRLYPHQLSGGMCQRVMIAIAAVCKPRLLIADEPTTSLDPAVQIQILELLAKINKDFGTAVLFISHDLSLVRSFCARILVMYAGKIIEQGPSEAIFSSPAHPYTRGLLGALPEKDKRGRALANIPGRVPSIEDVWTGCPFAPRCSQARSCCNEEFPEETAAGSENSADLHKVRCFFPGGQNA